MCSVREGVVRSGASCASGAGEQDFWCVADESVNRGEVRVLGELVRVL